MKGVKLFVRIALLTVCLVLMLFVILYFVWIKPKTGNLLDSSDSVQALTSIIALFIGTAATVGSAVATLQVASLGLEVSRSQAKRDKKKFIDEKVSNLIDVYSEIIVSVGDVFVSGLFANQRIPKMDNNEAEKLLKEKVLSDSDLGMELRNLSDNLDKLSIAIKTLAKNDFANYCFQNCASRLSGKLKEIGNKLIDELRMSESEVNIDITNLSEIASFIDIASKKIKNRDFELIISSKIYTNLNLSYDNSCIRDFFFTGNLIFVRSDDVVLNKSRKIFIASYGSAILHDLVRSIPSGEKIKEFLLVRYSSLIDEDDLKLIDYEPDNMVSSTLKKALDDAENIENLYFFIRDVN